MTLSCAFRADFRLESVQVSGHGSEDLLAPVGWIGQHWVGFRMAPIIDVHSHLGQFTNCAMSADGERLCSLSRAAGIAHVVTFSIEACYGTIDRGNRYTLDEVDRHSMLSAMVVIGS